MKDICVKFDDLILGYAGRAALRAGHGSIACGTLTAVVGANGSGKSTLLKRIAGILRPMSGMLLARCGRLAYLPQQSDIDRSSPARVIDLVSLGFWQTCGLLGRINADGRAALAKCMETVGLTGLENRSLDSLSGEQMQRALFARTMLQDADLILLDEPFNAVDGRTGDDLVILIKQWAAEGRTVVCVLHDLDLVRRQFPDAMLLVGELVSAGPTSTVLTPENLHRAREVQSRRDEEAERPASSRQPPLPPDDGRRDTPKQVEPKFHIDG